MNALCLFGLLSVFQSNLDQPVPAPEVSIIGSIQYSSFGVPKAKNFYEIGVAQASQRLWQMELSRRLARGRMSEIRGTAAIESDKQVLQTAYTDEELLTQVEALSADHYQEWVDYVSGVNDAIMERKAKGQLPAEYAEMNIEAEPWSLIDSAAIAVRLGNYFGGGGGGELRNLALTEILKTSPAKDQVLDVMDDFAFQDHPSSPCTVERDDDLNRNGASNFYRATRFETQKHLSEIPKVNIFELLPAIGLAENGATTRLAQSENVFYKTGSYAMVVQKSRSASGHALLLGAPQMGMSTPAPAYELAIDSDTTQFAGMGVPGVPTPIIGSAPNFSWTLTTGAADCRDIFYSTTTEDGKYLYDGATLDFEIHEFKLKVKGVVEPIIVTQKRTRFGPVILESKRANVVFSQKTSFWKQELRGYDAIRSVINAKNAEEIFAATQRVSLCFNFFFAMKNGDIGYRFCGYIPQRKPGFDPRFPIPGSSKADWIRMIPPDQMPWTMNPKSGLITNWNNKPVRWWPNLDTPAFGMVNHVQGIRDSLPSGPISVADLERANQAIGRKSEDGTYLIDLFRAAVRTSLLPDAQLARDYNGTNVDGSIGVTVYRRWKEELINMLFKSKIGNLGGDANLRTVAQPSVIVAALQGKTKVAYLVGTPEEMAQNCLTAALNGLNTSLGDAGEKWRWRANGVRFGSQPPMPFGNRGTYIQVIEEAPLRFGKSILLPGNAESGEHQLDQLVLGRSWEFKPMWELKQEKAPRTTEPMIPIMPAPTKK